MDLAGTPAIPAHAPPPATGRGEVTGVRLLSVAEAANPAFVESWETLARLAVEPNPFFEPWFLLPSFAHFAGDEDATIFAFYDGSRLVGLMPLASERHYYGYRLPHVAAWLHDNAFCGAPLVARGSERAFWQALLSQLDASFGSALLLHLPQLPEAGALTAALDSVLSDQARAAYTALASERAMLSSTLGPDAYFEQAMSAKKRKELRRQHKRLGEEGALTFERAEGSEGIEDWLTDFLALEAAGWKGEAGSALASADATSSFFTQTLTGAAEAGRLERLSLSLDGKPIAMLANFLCAPGAFSFKTAFDERYARFSPGLLLQIENLQLLARDGIDWTDSCAVQGHSMIERIWREKRTIASRNIAIGGPLRRTAFRLLRAYETRKRSSV